MASAVSADATTIQVKKVLPAISTSAITEPQTSIVDFLQHPPMGFPPMALVASPPEVICLTRPYKAELVLLQY